MQLIDGLPKLEDKILTGRESTLVYPYRTALADALKLNDRMLTLLGMYELSQFEDERHLAGLELAAVRRQWLEMREKHNLRVEGEV